MPLTYVEFLHEVVERGIKSAQGDEILAKYPRRLKGSIDGFNACRCKTPEQLAQLLVEANRKTHNARLDAHDKDEEGAEAYWEQNYYGIQVDFVCNVVSAMLMNENKPVIVPPRASGVMVCAEILGVAGMPSVPA